MDKALRIAIVLKLMLAVMMIASCVTQEREYTDNDWARLSQAVGEMQK